MTGGALTAEPSPAGLSAPTPPGGELRTHSPAPSLRWQPVDGADDYRVQISQDRDFARPLIEDRSPMARYVHGRPFEPGVYYWRVAAVKDSVVGSYSEAAGFEVLPMDTVFDVPPDADLATMREIIGRAAAHTPAKVRFSRGTVYRIAPDMMAFVLKDVSDLELDGNGATLIFTKSSAGFLKLSRCQRVTVRDFIVDFDPVPFSVGIVRTVDAENGTFTVVPEPGMAEFDAPYMLKHWTWGVLLDRDVPGRMKTGSYLVMPTVKERSGREGELFRIALARPAMISTVSPGDKYVQFARSNGGNNLIMAQDCIEPVFIDNTSYATAAGHYLLVNSEDGKVLGCRLLIKPGRSFGGNADGVHVRSCHQAPWVEGCTIEGIGDDGVAVYGKGIEILGRPDDTSLRLASLYFTLRAGDRFLVFDPQTGEPVAENLTVSAVRDVPAGDGLPAHKLVTFSPALPRAPRLDGDQAWLNCQVFDRTAQNQGFMLRRNVIKQARRYGTILRAVDCVIEENHYVQTSDSAITLHNEPRIWRNGLQSENILIQNNTIDDCNFTLSSRDRGSITVVLQRMRRTADGWQDEPSDWRGHRGITIRGNVIDRWQQRAISVQCAEDVEISGNRIGEALPDTLGAQGQYGIYLGNVSGARLRDNVVAPSPCLTRAVEGP